jgi:hypothetical protein
MITYKITTKTWYGNKFFYISFYEDGEFQVKSGSFNSRESAEYAAIENVNFLNNRPLLFQ